MTDLDTIAWISHEGHIRKEYLTLRLVLMCACCALSCYARRPPPSCISDADCASGFCARGVCCATPCSLPCERCSPTGDTCEALPKGTSAAECAITSPATCGTTGLCTGARSCAQYPPTTTCASGHCQTPSTYYPDSQCDGAGDCVPGGAQYCAYWSCPDCVPMGACLVDQQCTPKVCREHRCVGTNGMSCTLWSQCASGVCCGGQCADLPADIADCALCAAACTLPHAKLTCPQSTCGVLECDAGWADCNADPADGCESQLGTLEHCSSCTPCAPPHATPICSGGACQLVTCDPGYLNCDADVSNGCETTGTACP